MKPIKICVLMALAPASIAAPLSNYIKFDMGASVNWSDNGGRESRKALIISEFQNEYAANLDANYQNDWFAAKSLYNLEDKTFSEHSQPDDTVLTGNGQLDFGGSSQPLHLKIEHSNASLLNAQDAVDLTSNRLERSILSIEPSLRLHINDADQFVANFTQMDVNYKKFEAKNSTTKSVDLMYSRDVSAVDLVQIVASSGKTDFDINPQLSYRLDSFSAEYVVKLKKLQYNVSVGANRALQDALNTDFSSPKYSAGINYTSAFNSFGLNFSRALGDSSRAENSLSQGSDIFSPSDSSVSGVSKGIDIVQFTTIGASWTSTLICERCTSRVSLEKVKQDFQSLGEDLDRTSAMVNFTYQLGRASGVEFFYRASKQEFAENPFSPYQKDTSYQLTYRTKILNSLSLNAILRHFKRDSEYVFHTYKENIVGLGLDYSF